MVELGKKQTLTVERIKNFGVYVGNGKDDAVLLPARYVPAGTNVGDKIEVFVYRDSSDRMIATTIQPAIELGQTALLTVKEVGKIGVFLDWGLEKDLLLPFREQTFRPEKGQQVLVGLYIDKSERLCATMKVYDYLQENAPYQKNDMVSGVVYQVHERFGAFVAVDAKYHGMIPKNRMHGNLMPGDTVKARVEKVRYDGKLELTMSDRIDIQMDKDAAQIDRLLDSYDGVLPFTEKASPEVIERELSMSKAAFKRAVGRLLKQKKIEIRDGKIRKI